MKPKFPFYRLNELIEKKFGKDGLQLSFTIIASWMNFSKSQRTWSNYSLQQMCDAKLWLDFPVTAKEVEALRQLFSLLHYNELFSYPEQMPVQLRIELNTIANHHSLIKTASNEPLSIY